MTGIQRRDDLYIDLESLASVQPQSRTSRVRSEIYNKILDIILRKIKRFAMKKATCCTYNPPNTMIGMPLYPYEELINFLICELSKNGLKIERLNHNTLWISWSKDDLDWEQYNKFMRTKAIKENKAIPLKDYRENKFKDDIEAESTNLKHLQKNKPNYLDFIQ